MGRDRQRRITSAAQAALGDGERIIGRGTCWAAQRRSRVALAFLGRRQYALVLTDRRLLVFDRTPRGPRSDDLVIAKRYSSFTLERVRRVRPLLQLLVTAVNGSRFVFEFRPGQRELGTELAKRLTPPPLHAASESERSMDAAFWGTA